MIENTCLSINVNTNMRTKISRLYIQIRQFIDWNIKSDCKYDDGSPIRKKRSSVPDQCFGRCSLDREREKRQRTLFASQFPVSEYMDSVGRIGQVIMDTNLHSHEQCRVAGCKHPYSVDMSKYPRHRSKYTDALCGPHCARQEREQPHQRYHEKCTCAKFAPNQSGRM